MEKEEVGTLGMEQVGVVVVKKVSLNIGPLLLKYSDLSV